MSFKLVSFFTFIPHMWDDLSHNVTTLTFHGHVTSSVT